MFVVPPTVGQPKPLDQQIADEEKILAKYDAIPSRVAQTLSIGAVQQWSAMSFWGGLAVGAAGLLLLQWLGTSIVGAVREATTDPGAIAEKVVNKLQGDKKK